MRDVGDVEALAFEGPEQRLRDREVVFDEQDRGHRTERTTRTDSSGGGFRADSNRADATVGPIGGRSRRGSETAGQGLRSQR